jgi:hypothetical protein
VDEVERATRAKKTPPLERVPVPDQARLLFFEDSIFRERQRPARAEVSALPVPVAQGRIFARVDSGGNPP